MNRVWFILCQKWEKAMWKLIHSDEKRAFHRQPGVVTDTPVISLPQRQEGNLQLGPRGGCLSTSRQKCELDSGLLCVRPLARQGLQTRHLQFHSHVLQYSSPYRPSLPTYSPSAMHGGEDQKGVNLTGHWSLPPYFPPHPHPNSSPLLASSPQVIARLGSSCCWLSLCHRHIQRVWTGMCYVYTIHKKKKKKFNDLYTPD